MDALIWGPSFWNMLHFITIAYPEKPSLNDIKNHSNFIKNLGNLLPCKKCAIHYNNYIKNIKINEILSDKEKYMKFFWKLHNDVNQRNNRKEITFKKFLQIYQEIINDGNFNTINIFYINKLYFKLIIILIIIVSILLFFIFYWLKVNEKIL